MAAVCGCNQWWGGRSWATIGIKPHPPLSSGVRGGAGLAAARASSPHARAHRHGLWEHTPSCGLGGLLHKPPPQWALGTGASRVPPHGGGAEITVKPQGLHSLGNRTEITPRPCRSWIHISTGFVNSAPAGDPSNGCYGCWVGSGLSNVSFMGTCMWGLGWARVRAAGSSQSGSGA